MTEFVDPFVEHPLQTIGRMIWKIGDGKIENNGALGEAVLTQLVLAAVFEDNAGRQHFRHVFASPTGQLSAWTIKGLIEMLREEAKPTPVVVIRNDDD